MIEKIETSDDLHAFLSEYPKDYDFEEELKKLDEEIEKEDKRHKSVRDVLYGEVNKYKRRRMISLGEKLFKPFIGKKIIHKDCFGNWVVGYLTNWEIDNNNGRGFVINVSNAIEIQISKDSGYVNYILRRSFKCRNTESGEEVDEGDKKRTDLSFLIYPSDFSDSLWIYDDVIDEGYDIPKSVKLALKDILKNLPSDVEVLKKDE